MIKEEVVKIKWNPKNRKHLESVGLYFTKYGDETDIKVCNLTNGSHAIITAICDICTREKEMEYRTYLICKNKQNYYCCKKCENIKQTKTMVKKYGVKNPFQLESTKEKIVKSNIDKYNVKYTMQRTDMKEKYLNGENNIFYIDGRSNIKIDRNSSQYKKWRKNILKFYENKCMICKDNKNLEAHHIIAYSTDKEKALDNNNGVCLCEKCHRDFHVQFGFGNNTEEQFLFWLSSMRFIKQLEVVE